MGQILLAFSGKKQSGKNTSYSCIRLWRPEAQDFSFAESLKRMCVDILGLEEWQAFGTNEQKNTTVDHLLWENFPVPAYDQQGGGVFIGHPNGWRIKPHPSCATVQPLPFMTFQEYNGPEYIGDGIHPFWKAGEVVNKLPEADPDEAWHDGERLRRRRGPMTAREVLQYWGTEIFRKAYSQVWADACIRRIRKSGCRVAVITDCRFPNEVEAIQKAGGKVIKLTKVVFPDDRHPSETALDAEVFDQNRFDAILDNSSMTIQEQCEALYVLMRRWGYVSHKNVARIHA
jgi:hypothetical protein